MDSRLTYVRYAALVDARLAEARADAALLRQQAAQLHAALEATTAQLISSHAEVLALRERVAQLERPEAAAVGDKRRRG
jgi:hypothetical protein